jgi:hypothetical protein
MAKHDKNYGYIGKKDQQIAGISLRCFNAMAKKKNK